MSDLHLFYGPNAGYVLDLYDRYHLDPASVDPEVRSVFEGWREEPPPSSDAPHGDGIQAAGVDLSKVAGVVRLAEMIRTLGHRAAAINPLSEAPPDALEFDSPGLNVRIGAHLDASDLAALPANLVDGPLASDAKNALEALVKLRAAYSGAIGYETDHVQNDDERQWLREAIESQRFSDGLDAERKRLLMERLTEVETFERFLHTTLAGQKRFSLEGTDMIVPILDLILQRAVEDGVREVVIGMAHRGRLNVLAHVLGKPYETILSEFQASHSEEEEPSVSGSGTLGWRGDVKYHQGARLPFREEGAHEMPITLAPNPSHLEVVNPVILGRARAAQERRDSRGKPVQDSRAAGAILIHGDAAFPGQGVVAETLNLAGLAGYGVGGTIHVILNNQIGFTTLPSDSRSTLYASDLAKGFEVPIVHVNADDPAACIAAARLAYAYCSRFHKDFLIDLVGYRRWGHNEADEPAYTQPRMYAAIGKHPTVRELWARELERDGTIPAGEAEKQVEAVRERLRKAQEQTKEKIKSIPDLTGHEAIKKAPPGRWSAIETGVPAENLLRYNEEMLRLSEGFKVNPKLERTLQRRNQAMTEGGIDWGHAETLAFASILADGVPIRLSGQDAERGTFSQRHLVLHDPATDETHTPLETIPSARASFGVYNSPLSENAVLGFEYGYSIHARGVLVLWEAQFGDFANSAQVMIDQFLVSGQSKWGQTPSLVLLLPHGLEGQGPEHSSARPERFLQLCANDNLRVVNCTTAAQYFHLLRRQAALLETAPRPLVVMSPKSLLRHPLVASPLADFTQGTFQPVLDDIRARGQADRVTRVILCSGKIYTDLAGSKAFQEAERVALVRLEQLAPFPYRELQRVLSGYPHLRQIDWIQEEPANMGAWSYLAPQLRVLAAGSVEINYLGRHESSSPSEGSFRQYTAEQARIIAAGLMAAPELKRS